jgi:hypothetical protein
MFDAAIWVFNQGDQVYALLCPFFFKKIERDLGSVNLLGFCGSTTLYTYF